MRRSALIIAIAVLCVSAWAAKEFVMPRAYNAKTYPARDEHPMEKVTVAADPYDLPDKANIFTVDYLEKGFLPVHLIVTNDGDTPVVLKDMRVQMNLRDRSKVFAADRDDLLRRITTTKQGGPGGYPSPVPLPKKRSGVPKGALDEIERASFAAKVVEPHSTQSGFLFFDVSDLRNPLAGATLYVNDVKDADGKELMYFEIPMEKYLSYRPAQPQSENPK